MSEKLTAKTIQKILAYRYKGNGWALFPEFRTTTGYIEKERYVDLVAVGLWKKNRGIISYEIKVSRSDFTSDVKKFAIKHKPALQFSNEFYYICPSHLIRPEEVPKRAGLKWVTSKGRVLLKKRAKNKKIESVDFKFFQAFARRFSSK